jgi:hypothetical protein
MGKKNNFNETIYDTRFSLRKCEYCKGKDGKRKDIYETLQSALDAVQFIKKERKISLNIYPCEYGNGLHLSKNNAPSGMTELLKNINIPLRASDGSWYMDNETNNNYEFEKDSNNELVFDQKRNEKQIIPIVKIECKSKTDVFKLSGKIMEIKKDFNIEKIFGIDKTKPFCASMIKNILDGVVLK